MKLYFITFRTNYGLSVMIIEANSEEEATIIAKGSGAWMDSFDCNEIILTGTPKLLFHEGS